MHVDAIAVDPREGSTVGVRHQRPFTWCEFKGVDIGFGDAADVVQRQSGRLEELQASVTAVVADESRDEFVGRVGQHERGIRVLQQLPALAEHRDLVAECYGLVDIVRDEDDGLAQFTLQPQDLGLQLLAHHRVDSAERLVHQQDRRVGGQCTRHADALLLPAGQLRRIPVGELGIQADALEHAQRVLAGGAAGLAHQHRHGGHVVDHLQMRHQARTLDDVADAQPQLDRVDLRDVPAINGQRARGGLDHPVDHPHRGGLAAPGRTDEYRQRALGHLQCQIVHGNGAVRVSLGDAFECDHGSSFPIADLP